MVLSEGQLQSIETAILRMSRFRRSANPTDQTKGENFTYVLFALDIKAIVNDRAEAENWPVRDIKKRNQEFTNSPNYEFKVLHKGQTAF